MKKLLQLFILCVLTISLFGCGGSDSSKETSSSSKDESVTETKKEEPKNEKNKKLTLDEQVIYEEDGIKITLKEAEIKKANSPSLPVVIENETEQTICVQVRNLAVNGIMYDAMFSCEVAPGKKANDSIDFMNSDDRIDFSSISELEFCFHIFDYDSWETMIDSDPVVLALNPDFKYELNTAGDVVYDANGIKITYQGLGEDWLGLDVLFLIENNSDNCINVQTRDSSVNGYMIDAIMSTEVLPGKAAYTSMEFLNSFLEENEIEKDGIEEVEFYFHIFDNNTWNTIVDTDLITLK